MRRSGFTQWSASVAAADQIGLFYNVVSALEVPAEPDRQAADWSQAEATCSAAWASTATPDAELDFFDVLTNRTEDRLTNSNAYRRIVQDWRNCMRKQGYVVTSPVALLRGLVLAANRVSENGAVVAIPTLGSEADGSPPFASSELEAVESVSALRALEERLFEVDQRCRALVAFEKRSEVERKQIAAELLRDEP